MLIQNRRYRIVSNRVAIAAAVVLLSVQFFPSRDALQQTAGSATASEQTGLQTSDQTSDNSQAVSFSDFMVDLGLLLFLHK